MSSEEIRRPGETIESTLAELLQVTESSPAEIEWQERMRTIESAERTAESESSSIRIR